MLYTTQTGLGNRVLFLIPKESIMLKLLCVFLVAFVVQDCFAGTLYLQKNDGMADSNNAVFLEYTATLEVRYDANKGVNERRAWQLTKDALASGFYSGLEDSICYADAEEAKGQAAWVRKELKEQHVPVKVRSVRYTCKR
jgi:hypothetical protein